MTEFRYVPGTGGLLVAESFAAGEYAGSVLVREDKPPAVISLAQLYTVPDARGRGVARDLMEHVLWLYQPSAAWLYANPFRRDGDKQGPSREVLERFYASLGFEAARGRREPGLMVRYR